MHSSLCCQGHAEAHLHYTGSVAVYRYISDYLRRWFVRFDRNLIGVHPGCGYIWIFKLSSEMNIEDELVLQKYIYAKTYA